MKDFENFLKKHSITILSLAIFIVPLIIYILTLQPKIISGSTAWYATAIPDMRILPPPGYPVYSLLTKLFTMIPFFDLAYKLNLFSAIFGASAVLVLMHALRLLTNNLIISSVGALTYAFIIPVWSTANRLAASAYDSFVLILLLFAAVYYSKNTNPKTLYLFFFSAGLSLTGSPINLYILPVLIAYAVIINPVIFKNAKTIMFSILIFIIPLLPYLYILIRSIQGYGNADTPLGFLLYILGRSENAFIYLGDIRYKSISESFKIFWDYLKLMYENLGIYFITTSILGLLYFFKKNRIFALFILFGIIINFYIVSQYYYGPVLDYVFFVLVAMTIYNCYFLLFFYDLAINIINKKTENKTKIKIHLSKKKIILIFLSIIFFIQPVLFAVTNYKDSDNSEIDPAYVFWTELLDRIEDNSSLYISTNIANIGKFINEFESDKQTRFVLNNDADYTLEEIGEDLNRDKAVYFIGNEGFIKNRFKYERTGIDYFDEKFNEGVVVNRVTDEKVLLEITNSTDELSVDSGDTFQIEYKILNRSEKNIKIDSLELKLPENLEYSGIDNIGYIKSEPGISQGKYMWVSDLYMIEGNGTINIIVLLTARESGTDVISFRITTQNIFIEAKDIEAEVN